MPNDREDENGYHRLAVILSIVFTLVALALVGGWAAIVFLLAPHGPTP
jgi:hypothetical protein